VTVMRLTGICPCAYCNYGTHIPDPENELEPEDDEFNPNPPARNTAARDTTPPRGQAPEGAP
jgi:hypothetical protein